MNEYFSDKLKIVSFFAIIIVFYIHADFPEQVYQTMRIPVFTRTCIAGVFGPCANPLFFAISGYLFFYSINRLEGVFVKMKKRVRSLLVPFLIAAPIFPLFFAVLELIPGASSYFPHLLFWEKFKTLPLKDTLVSMFYDCGTGYPWSFHLWFLRDLICIVAISPLIYLFRKWFSYWVIIPVVALYLLCPNIFFLYPLYWFLAGSFFLFKLRLNSKYLVLCGAAFLTMAIIRLCGYWEVSDLYKLIERTFGVVSLWCIYDLIVPVNYRLSSSKYLSQACSVTFFMYVYHEPFFNIVVKGIPILFGGSELGWTFSYLFSPIIFAVIIVSFGLLIKNKIPSFYSIIAGGR